MLIVTDQVDYAIPETALSIYPTAHPRPVYNIVCPSEDTTTFNPLEIILFAYLIKNIFYTLQICNTQNEGYNSYLS